MKQLLVIKSVDTLVQEFAARLEQFSVPSVAKGACKLMSYELAKFLRQHNTACQVLHLQSKVNECPRAQPIWLSKPLAEWSHYVVAVGSEVYDLTAKQFDPQFGYPFSCNLSYLRHEWQTVEVDEFLNSLVEEFYPST